MRNNTLKRLPKNWIELYLVEECRNLTWLSKQTGIAYSTLYHKIAKRDNSELIHTLTYNEYVMIENLTQGINQ